MPQIEYKLQSFSISFVSHMSLAETRNIHVFLVALISITEEWKSWNKTCSSAKYQLNIFRKVLSSHLAEIATSVNSYIFLKGFLKTSTISFPHEEKLSRRPCTTDFHKHFICRCPLFCSFICKKSITFSRRQCPKKHCFLFKEESIHSNILAFFNLQGKQEKKLISLIFSILWFHHKQVANWNWWWFQIWYELISNVYQ